MNQPLALSVINSMPLAHTRDTSRTIVLIGFQRHSNLGIGYLAANLQRWGYRADVFDFEADREQILRAAQAVDPVLIGFSLIFQSYITWFGSLISYLREHGVICHFTMGGHFPSLSYERALELVPELDSVVRFEGEETLLELVDFPTSAGTGAELLALPIAKTSRRSPLRCDIW